jgi:glycosyltransferase involved in cell wall biosynthesis
MFRKAGLPASFPSFAERRLEAIRGEVEARVPANPCAIIFHGITPWVACKPSVPYFTFSDCSFDTYMDLYHERKQFSERDLARINKAEGAFMAKAAGVWFTVNWSLNEAKRQYQLDGQNLLKMGQGATMEIPADAFDARMPGKQFLFIATDFLGKGGAEISRAFQKIHAEDPAYRLVIIGQKPPDEYLQLPGVEFLGYVNKSSAEGRQRFSEIYRNSRGLLMLTRKDIFPIVLIEAGLHGCPSVANRQSAIPEVILDGKTGYLIDTTEGALEQAMRTLMHMPDGALMDMRHFTARFYEENHAWEEIYQRILGSMRRAGVVTEKESTQI